MKTHEWKAMGRVIYGSRKTAFFEEKKANFAAGLNCTTRRANRVCVESLDCKPSGKRENSSNLRSVFSSVRILFVSGRTRRRAAPKFRRYSAHCSPTGKGVVDDDARQLHAKPLRQFFEVQSSVIELDIAQWLIHCHGVGERSPSSSSTACSVGLQARSAESSH